MVQVPTPLDIKMLSVVTGVTIAQACKRAGMSHRMIYQWLGGKSDGPTVEKLRRLIDAMNECQE